MLARARGTPGGDASEFRYLLPERENAEEDSGLDL
jgi:hypothetical protein